MSAQAKVTADHLRKQAILYVRQSTLHQVKENRESTAQQYDLKRHAQELGWNAEQTVVIDEDLGQSGAATIDRSGFQRLVAEVGLGRVGLVMGLNASRLARNNADWHRLLEICGLAGTLIVDEDGIYDPNHFNDRLLLGLKGTMSEAELYMLRARLIGGLLNKARRGELWLRPPIGFVYDENQKFVLDPDEQIRGAVQLLFDTFRLTGSAGQVVRHFSKYSILWPSRAGPGSKACALIFRKLRRSTVQSVLHNPRYAGAFVYGRTRKRRRPDGRKQTRWLARDEWQVLIPDAHPAYISWKEYESNLAKLRENGHMNGSERLKGPVREGGALLQGLALCGRCGLRMTVRYHLRKGGKLVPNYVCKQLGNETGQSSCQYVAGTGVDEAVGRAVVEAVTPSALDVALRLFEELRARKADVDRLRRAQVERAREEAELAKRQYMLARPENRLVVDTLERQWNDGLARLAQAEIEYSRVSKADGPDLSAEDKERVAALAFDFPGVWRDPRTSARDRKRMSRLLIEDVTLVRDGELIRAHLRWKGGASTSLEVSRPRAYFELVRTRPETIETIRAMAAEQTDGQIAHALNSRLYRSGAGKTFTGLMVRHLRLSYGIESYGQQLRRNGWLTVPEIACRVGVHPTTAKTYAKRGLLRAVRINDKGDLLFEPIAGPIPRVHRSRQQANSLSRRDVTPQMSNEVHYET